MSSSEPDTGIKGIMKSFILFSPYVIILFITCLSFIFENYSGIVYFVFICAVTSFRFALYKIVDYIKGMNGSGAGKGGKRGGGPESTEVTAAAAAAVTAGTGTKVAGTEEIGPKSSKYKICNSSTETPYLNDSYSSFILTFTVIYLFLPMFLLNIHNYIFFSFFVFYWSVDIVVKYITGCIYSKRGLIIDIIFGGILASLIIMWMMSNGSAASYLFFNELSSNTNVCYKPSNETFKCYVYSNGNLVSEIA